MIISSDSRDRIFNSRDPNRVPKTPQKKPDLVVSDWCPKLNVSKNKTYWSIIAHLAQNLSIHEPREQESQQVFLSLSMSDITGKTTASTTHLNQSLTCILSALFGQNESIQW